MVLSIPNGRVPDNTAHNQSSGIVRRHAFMAGKYFSIQASMSVFSRTISGAVVLTPANRSVIRGGAVIVGGTTVWEKTTGFALRFVDEPKNYIILPFVSSTLLKAAAAISCRNSVAVLYSADIS